jgi:hypothetical protein
MVGRFRRRSIKVGTPMTRSETGNRPPNRGGTNAEKTTGNRGGATRGPAGAIRRTRNTAPDAAGPDLIQAVALRACRDDADPAEIWATIRTVEGKDATAVLNEYTNQGGSDR